MKTDSQKAWRVQRYYRWAREALREARTYPTGSGHRRALVADALELRASAKRELLAG